MSSGRRRPTSKPEKKTFDRLNPISDDASARFRADSESLGSITIAVRLELRRRRRERLEGGRPCSFVREMPRLGTGRQGGKDRGNSGAEFSRRHWRRKVCATLGGKTSVILHCQKKKGCAYCCSEPAGCRQSASQCRTAPAKFSLATWRRKKCATHEAKSVRSPLPEKRPRIDL